jgi:hypothetical protein
MCDLLRHATHSEPGAVHGSYATSDTAHSSCTNTLASNYQWSCSLLATAPTLTLDQVNPVAFIRVHTGLVCLGRYPSIDYQLALAVARGSSNRVPSS